MACFLVPAAEAAVVGITKKVIKETKKRKGEGPKEEDKTTKFSLYQKLNLLFTMLSTGSILLMFEHIWHGEIVPYAPFLTAAGNAEDTRVMLHEMATVGVSMACLVTAVWAIICVAVDLALKKKEVTIK